MKKPIKRRINFRYNYKSIKMSDKSNRTSSQLKQNPLFFISMALLVSATSTEISEFTSIPSKVISIFAALLAAIPLVWWFYIWLKKRKN